jgi:cytochrome c-type biogenesis protein CcmF
VENASFLPWLTSTAYLHSVIIQEKKNMLRLWNVVLIMITFVLTIFGTYLTRSGILSSVHAFAASEMSQWFFGFMILLILGCVILIVLRKEDLASTNRLESFTSRESGFLFNNMIFLALTLAILWGTMFPLLSEAVRGTQITVGSPYFDRITAPMGMILLLLLGVGPLLAWRRTSLGTVKRNFIIPTTVAVAVMVAGLLMGFYSFYAVLTVGLSAFVAAGIFMELGRAIRARRHSTGESVLTALRNIVDRNRSRYGGYIVHLGIIVMFIGFAGKAFTVEQDLTLNDGEQAQLGGYTFTMERHYTAERSNHSAKVIDLKVNRGDRFITILKPEKRFYTDQNNQPNSEVAIYSRPLRDLYAILGDVDLSSGTAVLKIMINPLVQLVWWGGLIMVAGTIVVLLPSAAERKLKARLA